MCPPADPSAHQRPHLTTDRFSVYGYLDPERHSGCWAHLIRDLLAGAARGGVDRAVAHWLLDRMETVLTHWHALGAGTRTRAEFLAAVLPLREGFRAPLEWGRARGSRWLRALCRALLANWEALWSWQTVEGGANKQPGGARLAASGAVAPRKLSGGHQSESGK